MSLVVWIQAFLAILPLINQLIALFTQTPAEKQAQLVTDLHAAFQNAVATGGDTSDIENIIKKGK